MGFNPNELSDIVARLDDLPPSVRPRRTHGATAALRILEPHLRAAIERGYSLKELAAILNKEGVAATISTLKNALYRRRPTEHPVAKQRAETAIAGDGRTAAIAHFGRHRSGIPSSVLDDSFADSVLVR